MNNFDNTQQLFSMKLMEVLVKYFDKKEELLILNFNNNTYIIKYTPVLNPISYTESPLYLAAYTGNTKIVKYLLACPNINPNTTTQWIKSSRIYEKPVAEMSIYVAAHHGYIDIIKLFAEDPRINFETYASAAFLYASGAGNLDIVKYLIENSFIAEPFYVLDSIISYHPKQYPLEDISGCCHSGGVIDKNFIETIKYLLLLYDIDPEYCPGATLNEVARSGNLELLQVLLDDPRIDPMIGCFENFYYPTRTGNFDISKSLILHNKTDLLHTLKIKTPDLNLDFGQEERMTLYEMLIHCALVYKYSGYEEFIKFLESHVDKLIDHNKLLVLRNKIKNDILLQKFVEHPPIWIN